MVLIQACQADQHVAHVNMITDAAAPARSVKETSQLIHLKRPNSVVLLATVSGGTAIRGAFTGAFADEIRMTDGEKDIYSMFTAATFNMQNADDSTMQQPLIMSTLTRRLVLPPALTSGSGMKFV